MYRQIEDEQPWYKYGWLWFVIALPSVTVVAGIITIIIAVKYGDTTVVDDYYKQGLAINQTLHKQQQAQTLGLAMQLNFDLSQKQLIATISANDLSRLILPAQLYLKCYHSTFANQDQTIVLNKINVQRYQATLPNLVSGRWHLHLSHDNWKITASIHIPQQQKITLR